MLKWNKHPSKWLACYLKWIILVISKLLVTTDGRRFCHIKETDNSHSRWQSFQFRFNSSAEIVCNQLNFNRNFFVFSRIFCLRNNSVNPNINRSFFQPSVIFFSDCRLGSSFGSVKYTGTRSQKFVRGFYRNFVCHLPVFDVHAPYTQSVELCQYFCTTL